MVLWNRVLRLLLGGRPTNISKVRTNCDEGARTRLSLLHDCDTVHDNICESSISIMPHSVPDSHP